MSNLTEGGIVGPLLRLAAPFALGNLFNVVNVAVDRMWVGDVGTDAMAALGTAQVAVMVFATMSLGMSVGTLSGVARSVGRGDPERARTFFGQGMIIGAGLALTLALSGFWLPHFIMEFMGAEPAVAGPAEAYLRISMWGMLVQVPATVMIFALQGAGRARSALVVGVVSPIVNIVLDPLLIFTAGLGVAGAAWATSASYLAGAIAGLFMIRRELGVAFNRALFRFQADVAREIVGIGVPGTLEHTVRTVASFSLVKILTPFGAVVISAYTSSMVIVLALIFPGLAMGQATASLVGQNLGAGKPRRAWRTAWVAVGLYALFMALLGALVYWQAAACVGIFDDNPAVVAEGVVLLRTLVLCWPFIAVALVLSKAFGGAGNTVPAMLAAAVGHVFWQIPLVWYLADAFGPTGAYWGITTAFMVHALLSTIFFVRRFRPDQSSRDAASAAL